MESKQFLLKSDGSEINWQTEKSEGETDREREKETEN